MPEAASNANFYFVNTNRVMRENLGRLCPDKSLKNLFNGYVASNMRGITFFYNYVTKNTVTNLEQSDNLDRLNNIKNLEEGWNGHGSSAISDIVIERAKKFITYIVKQPLMFPTGRDSIQMQYELKDKSYLEFEIYKTKVMCMFVPKRIYQEAEFKEFTDIEMDRFNQIVKEFYGK